MTLEEIRARKALAAKAIAEVVSREINALQPEIGLTVSSVYVSIMQHRSAGRPDLAIVHDVKIDVGEI